MSLINSRAHSNTAAFNYLTRAIAAFDSNVASVASKIHRTHPHAPSATISDAIALLVENDRQLMADFFSAQCPDATLSLVTDILKNTFEQRKDDLTPSRDAICKLVGRKLGMASHDLLSLAGKLAVMRGTLTKSEAQQLCTKRLESKRRALGLSVATL
jgi:hypothetical protein